MTVQVTDEVLGRAARDARTALVELIRNAIDADACNVTVDVVTAPDPQAPLDGDAPQVATTVRVSDDGHGISPKVAEGPFGRWGDTWKATARYSPGNRLMLGKNGEGRFGVYALGGRAVWDSVSGAADADGSGPTRVRIRGEIDRRKVFGLENEPADGAQQGTRVTIDRLGGRAASWLLREDAAEALIPPLAQALRAFPVKVIYRGRLLETSSVVVHEEDLQVVAGADTAVLTVVEWSRRLDKNKLLWCDESGMSYLEEDPGVAAPGFPFTAYLKWEGSRAASSDLSLREGFQPSLAPLGKAALAVLREHLAVRQGRRRRELVQQWREEDSYPYEGEAAGPAEGAERDLFEVIAVAASPTISSISSRKARGLTLRLLREALASDPGRLRHILDQVLDMPAQDLDDLHSLLQRTSMSGLVRLSRIVDDRLLAVQGIRGMLAEPGTYERVLERRHLHEVLVQNTWVFGEEYSLFGSDETLRVVTRRHAAAHLGRDDLVDTADESLGDDGDLRLDIALARALPASTGTLHVLVVEIKRPKLTINREHAEQLYRYADALTRDPEYVGARIQWDFLLVGNTLNTALARGLDREGVYSHLDERHPVRVRTWADVMQGVDFRINWLQRELGAQATREQGLGHLRRVHENTLPPD